MSADLASAPRLARCARCLSWSLRARERASIEREGNVYVLVAGFCTGCERMISEAMQTIEAQRRRARKDADA